MISSLSSRSLLALASLAALVAGCGPDCTKYTGDLTLVLGSGNASNPSQFAALTDGASVELARGNQGGQHVWLLVYAGNACPSPPRVRAVVRGVDGTNLGFALSEGIPWVPAPDNQLATEPLAIPVQRDNICRIIYQGATLEVTVTDGSGRMAQRSVRIHGATFAGFVPERDCVATFPDGGATDAARD
jgi:hypothetical protein